MLINLEIFKLKKRQRITTNAFFSYVAQITNKNIIKLLTTDKRFNDIAIDINKIYLTRLKLKYIKKKVFKHKSKCPITGRYRGKLSFFGQISRFQLKEMTCDGRFLIGISRFGW